jgi:hypothetical protein
MPLAVFTDSAWFQVLYPVLFFLLSFVPIARHAAGAPATAPAAPATTVPELPPPTIRHTHINATVTFNWFGWNGRRGWKRWAGLLIVAFVLFVIAALILAELYLHMGRLAVPVIVGLIAFAGGGIAGWIVTGIQQGRLDPSWWWLFAGLVGCGCLILWASWRLTHPPDKPPGYDVLVDVYRHDGLPDSALSDRTTRLLITQGAGMASLGLATLTLLAIAGGLVLRAMGSARAMAGSGGRLLLSLTTTRRRLVVLGCAFAGFLLFALGCVDGQVYESVDPGVRPTSAELLRTELTTAGTRMSLTYICTQPARLEIVARAQHGGRMVGRWTASCEPGANANTIDLPRAVHAVVLTLAPLDNPAAGRAFTVRLA